MSDRARSILCRKPAAKLNCDWSVWADDSNARRWKLKLLFLLYSFSTTWILKCPATAITSSSWKFLKLEFSFVFFWRYHLLAEWVTVDGTRQHAPVSGTWNRHLRLANVSSLLSTHNLLENLQLCGGILYLSENFNFLFYLLFQTHDMPLSTTLASLDNSASVAEIDCDRLFG